MPKKPIARAESFSDEDEAEGGEVARPPRPAMPMDEANAVYDKGVGALPSAPYVSPKVKLQEAEERNRQLEALVIQMQQQGASGLSVQDGTLSIHDFQLSPTGLVAPEHFSQEAWEQIGLLLFKLEGAIQWLIGDWLVYGADLKYGDIDDIARALGREPETLHQYASVCRNVKSWIRIHNLSYGHHKLVAPLSDQKQSEALAYAAENNLSVANFRKWLRGESDTPALPAPEENELKPLASQFKKLMSQDRTQAEEYLNRVEQWAADMRVQLRGQV